ncbi:MAG: Asp-tRNA(Asn)/Glu-tRNA(Gln) amidotransferase subunit GatA [Bacilli bacterium]|nr:Asp-tRNA(Asn)/Glu-tRNA(Gln) amidotransferase subunit GatA [Bacilli bacterium]
MSFLDLTISEIHKALVEKKTTPLALVQEALERARENDDNAFESLVEEQAIEEAKALEEPEADNPLWGIPFVLKDNYSTKGIETTASSNILNGYIPLFDATVYAKLKEKKAILIGKTTLDELAMGGTGTTGHNGKTFNPWDPTHERLIGGSSCGSAACVAAGIVPFALGSDTGDSVRKPASYAGLVGFKPTWGRISRFGLFPFAPSLDHVAYFTRDVKDAALLLDVLSGRDPHDLTSSPLPAEVFEEDLEKPLKGAKIAVIDDIVKTISDQKLREGFDRSLAELEKAGIEIGHVNFGEALLQSVHVTYIVISCAEATSNDANLDGIKFGPFHSGETYQDVMFQARTKGFSELIKRRFVIGSFSLMRENQDVLFRRAQKNRRKIVDRLNEILGEYDAIYVPAVPSVAPKFASSSDKLSDEYLIADNHLALGNFGGLPSITVPLMIKDGLPIGANLTSGAFTEKKLFSLAKVLEKITGLENLSTLNKKEGRL